MKSGKKSSMTEERIAKLVSIVGFQWNPKKDSWNETFRTLKTYKKKHGHCDVPYNYSKNPSLGRWVSQQRPAYMAFKAGKKSSMTEDMITKLESIDFKGNINLEKWHKMFQALKSYKKQNRHCDVPYNYSKNPTLGRWVSKQRQNYFSLKAGKKFKSKLTEEKIAKLASIGCSWAKVAK